MVACPASIIAWASADLPGTGSCLSLGMVPSAQRQAMHPSLALTTTLALARQSHAPVDPPVLAGTWPQSTAPVRTCCISVFECFEKKEKKRIRPWAWIKEGTSYRRSECFELIKFLVNDYQFNRRVAKITNNAASYACIDSHLFICGSSPPGDSRLRPCFPS